MFNDVIEDKMSTNKCVKKFETGVLTNYNLKMKLENC